MKRISRFILNSIAAALLLSACVIALLWIAGRYSPQEIYRTRHILGNSISTATDTDDYLDFSDGEISLFHHNGVVVSNVFSPQDPSYYSFGYEWGESEAPFEKYKVSLPANFSPRLGFAAAYLGKGVNYFVLPLWFLLLVTGWFPMLRFAPMAVRWMRGRRIKPGCCRECGYDLRESKEQCPECGTAISESSVACE